MKIHKIYQLSQQVSTSFFYVLILCTAVSLAGCATAGKDAIPQKGDMTMAQIYKQETGLSMTNAPAAFNQQNQDELQKARKKVKKEDFVSPDRVIYTGYTANGKNQINNLFKKLPNPEIALYVYPHLVYQNGDAQPVPGYTTAFFLYQKNHFAMPSEVY